MTEQNEFGIPEEKPEVKVDDGIKRDKDGRPYRLIRVEMETEKESFLPVGHNGDTYQIRRGEAVEVPQCVVDVLNDCVASRLVEIPHPVTGEITKELRDYHSVPFQVLR